MAEHLRLFVAIELPGEVRDALSRLQHELQRRGLEKLRWVRPEGIHLTLKFLGETPADKVPAIEQALREAVVGVGRFPIWLGYADTFRGEKIPRVLWVGVSNARRGWYDVIGSMQRLQNLQARVENALDTIGFPREKRGFSAHLTLARVRHGTGSAVSPLIRHALDASESWDEIIAGPDKMGLGMEVREISLMRSTLRPSGAVYERLSAFPLAGA